MVPSLSIGNCLLNCLFQVVFGWHPKVRNGQIQHLESRFVIQRSQIASGLVETFFIARQENNDPNLFLTKAVIDLAMQIVRFCRKVAFLRPNEKITCRKINGLRVSTFLFSVICDRTWERPGKVVTVKKAARTLGS